MTRTIVFTQQKGGAGKTMLLTQLAALWLDAGKAVAIVDLDGQRSAAAWVRARATAEGRPQPRLFESADWRASSDIRDAGRDADFVLVDTAGHSEALRLSAMAEVDMAVIPCQPSMTDVWATGVSLDLVRGGKLPYAVVVNRYPPRSRVAEAAIAALAETGAPIAETRIGTRAAFAEAFMQGLGATEIQPRSKAAAEIRALAGEVGGA